MKRYRSILACLLAFVMAFIVGCGSPQVKEPPTYSDAQLQQIQKYESDILGLRDRMTTELPAYINTSKWVEVDNFVHGPLGTLLQEMNYLTKNLLPNDQPPARKLSREVFEHLLQVGEAAEKADRSLAASSYQAALEDLDAFLNLVPQASQAPKA
ncbi:MAG: photosystem II protein PsbQ [Lyngbya sp.]|nr:photosystem II protein PsbQ [Lyngbya sp.]